MGIMEIVLPAVVSFILTADTSKELVQIKNNSSFSHISLPLFYTNILY